MLGAEGAGVTSGDEREWGTERALGVPLPVAERGVRLDVQGVLLTPPGALRAPPSPSRGGRGGTRLVRRGGNLVPHSVPGLYALPLTAASACHPRESGGPSSMPETRARGVDRRGCIA